MGAAQLLPIAVALALPLLLARWGTGYTLLTGILAAGGCLFLFALGSQPGAQAATPAGPAVWLVAGAYLAAITIFTVTTTARDMFGQELVSLRWRTSSQAVAILGSAFGGMIAGVAGGALIAAIGFGALFSTGALASLAAAGLLGAYVYKMRKQRAARALTELTSPESE
jgi:hypothetical protein